MITVFKEPQNLVFYFGNPFRLEVVTSTEIVDNYLTYKWEYATIGLTNWLTVPDTSAETFSLYVTPQSPAYGGKDFRVTVTEYNSTDVQQSQYISPTVTVSQFMGRTSTTPTKARDGSKIRSRHANVLEFVQDPALDTISISGNIGHPTLVDASNHVDFRTVQSAISDAAFMGQLNVGDIILNTTNVDPSGSPQIDLITFTGNVVSPTSGMPVVFDIFGKRLEVIDNASSSSVRDLVLAILHDYADDGLYVKNVQTVSSDSISYTYLDMKPHTPPSWIQYGISMSSIVSSPVVYGYGNWEKILTESKIGTDTQPFQLNYWKRIA